ncbi:Tn3 family transposase [Mesorhizobium sp. L-2-11]|uniref:Tn3 family transposase n=2 Tax=Pseudomonadota TaxID=1224 RepID=UPI0018EB6493|nr:Tn3 family transposase [Mesorhizobium sp. L-2-11]BCH16796.1 transposase [Mesorhizobium sp. L-2-11]BCH17223.1 transposase [Mesorhizobium sp. L-2-11]BCH19473.1 transposase [Mesorhizobium sp. L-2-11]BCH19888.1 transposase [Mesorhizobium sp. L-2-11]
MAHRSVLTDRQRATLFDLPTDEVSLLRHYTLADDDLVHIRERRRPENRLGFALQLCALRYPGRTLYQGEVIPDQVLAFIAAQIGVAGDALLNYAVRRQTRQQHMEALRAIYGYKNFAGRGARELKESLDAQAEDSRSNEDLARRFVDGCRQTQTILPAISMIERLCADALVAAERRIEMRITDRLDQPIRDRLDMLLTEMTEGNVSRFVWLRRTEPGDNSALANRLLDRLEFLAGLGLKPQVLDDVPPHRIARLRRQGERYFADGLRDIGTERRLAILAVCVVEWAAAIGDAVVETHDRIVGKTWREAKRLCDGRVADAKTAVTDTLRAFSGLGTAMLEARNDGISLETAIATSPGWPELEKLVATASQLTDTLAADPLAHVIQGFHRFRRYAPRMLRCLEIQAASVAEPLMRAIALIREKRETPSQPTTFLRPTSKWNRHLKAQDDGDHRLWEVAVLFHLRDAFRSGDVWLAHSRRYADLKQALVPMSAALATTRLAVPFEPGSWLADRKARMADGLKRLARAARSGTIPLGSIEDGTLHLERLTAATPQDADELILDLYRRMPEVRITDILLDVDAATGFTEAFTHLRTGAPCQDKIGLLNVLLAEGLNLGLRKMAEASNTHDYWQLSRLSRWHVESDAIDQALAMVVAAQGRLPMAQFWGMGATASSDGQFFPTARQGEAMNLINAKYGNEPGVKAYTHLSDQFAPFATQLIPATVSEAPYILDGLLMNEAGQRVREQYADTGGFTDHVFATASILGYRFIPHIRDLPSKRLYVFNPAGTPSELRGLVGGKIREDLIVSNWSDILRSAATMVAGIMAPSQLLRKFASYPRQHDLALALREVGRIERTLFIIEWILDVDMQRRARIGLNKGEAHHALKNALRIGRQGEIRDRTTEGQHYRIAGLNLLAAIIIYWNTVHLGRAVLQRRNTGLDVPPELLAHISPLGWAHILLTGEYRWPKPTKRVEAILRAAP